MPYRKLHHLQQHPAGSRQLWVSGNLLAAYVSGKYRACRRSPTHLEGSPRANSMIASGCAHNQTFVGGHAADCGSERPAGCQGQPSLEVPQAHCLVLGACE
jgi:hypothetical protein